MAENAGNCATQRASQGTEAVARTGGLRLLGLACAGVLLVSCYAPLLAGFGSPIQRLPLFFTRINCATGHRQRVPSGIFTTWDAVRYNSTGINLVRVVFPTTEAGVEFVEAAFPALQRASETPAPPG